MLNVRLKGLIHFVYMPKSQNDKEKGFSKYILKTNVYIYIFFADCEDESNLYYSICSIFVSGPVLNSVA